MKHYEVRNEETRTERPPQTHWFFFFAGPRNPPFCFCAPKGDRDGAGAVGARGAPGPLVNCSAHVQRGISISATQAVLGLPFLGVSAGSGKLDGSLQLPQRPGTELAGEEQRYGTLAPDSLVSYTSLHHATSLGLGRVFAVIVLGHDLWTPSLDGEVLEKLGW